MERSVILIHQKKHVGGGNSYVRGLLSGFTAKGYKVFLLEDKKPSEIISFLIRSKTKLVIWSVYEDFPILPYIISLISGKKNIFVVYGIWALESRSHFIGSLNGTNTNQRFYEIGLLIRQFCFLLSSSLIVHLSKYSKRIFLKDPVFRFLGRKKSVIIYGGVNEKVFKKISGIQKSKLRRKYGLNKSDSVLLMVGRMEKRKNFIDGIRILKEIKKQSPKLNIFLYLVISYGYFNDYRHIGSLFNEIGHSGVGGSVRILTGIGGEDIADMYKISDCYLMLSKELETFGLVTLEALKCGVPVFGYKYCATQEIVSNGKEKTLFVAGEYTKIARSILNYLKMTISQKRIYTAGLSEKVSGFKWENASDRITDLL